FSFLLSLITVLAGGVGAARFLQGLLAVHRPSDITIISNVGDDAEFFGLHISPDIDIVLYHLAGLSDEEQGFGIRGDTYNVLEAIMEAGAVILTPSHPLVSIGPILSIAGIRDALRTTPARVAAVSPIVGGKALKGPADRMLRDQGIEPSAAAIAKLYEDFLDVLVIDNVDADLKAQIESDAGEAGGGGVEVIVTDTIMESMEKKAALARTVLKAVTA